MVIVLNITAPRTRREGAIDQLTSQGRGLSISIFMHSLTWMFAFPTFIRFPNSDVLDFWPIYILLNAWMGVVLFVFLGPVSRNFRLAILSWCKKSKAKGDEFFSGIGFLNDDDDDNSTSHRTLANEVVTRPTSVESKMTTIEENEDSPKPSENFEDHMDHKEKEEANEYNVYEDWDTNKLKDTISDSSDTD
jgi:hypothetical protein